MSNVLAPVRTTQLFTVEALHVCVVFVSLQYIYIYITGHFVAVRYIVYKKIYVLLHYTCVVHACIIIVGFSRCVGLYQSL